MFAASSACAARFSMYVLLSFLTLSNFLVSFVVFCLSCCLFFPSSAAINCTFLLFSLLHFSKSFWCDSLFLCMIFYQEFQHYHLVKLLDCQLWLKLIQYIHLPSRLDMMMSTLYKTKRVFGTNVEPVIPVNYERIICTQSSMPSV